MVTAKKVLSLSYCPPVVCTFVSRVDLFVSLYIRLFMFEKYYDATLCFLPKWTVVLLRAFPSLSVLNELSQVLCLSFCLHNPQLKYIPQKSPPSAECETSVFYFWLSINLAFSILVFMLLHIHCNSQMF